jgi:hypothetical protein
MGRGFSDCLIFMITQYFDLNQRLIIQSPGTLAPATSTPWVYGDNYNLAIYLTAAGIIQPIGPNDTLGLMLFQPIPTLPETNLAIIGSPIVSTDPAGFQYYLVNVNLKTTALAALVQTPNQSAKCEFHYLFTPADGERFSSSADLAITVNPDPTVGASGATPVPPGYPTNPNVFEQIANKAVPNGYASLDATGKVPVAELPTSTAGGDMLKSVYDTNNNGIVDTCDTLVSSRVIGLGTAAVVNVPATGNATATQAVLGSDTRLADTRTPIAHQATHNGGTDPIPLASSAAQGLCPPVDGTTVQVVGGKLTATTTGTGDMLKSVFVTGSPTNTNTVDNTLAVQTHQVPATGNASGAQLVIATDTRLSDARIPQLHASTHLTAGSDPIALVTTVAAGLCVPPDGTTIQITGGKLAAVASPVGQHGARYYNNANVPYATAGAQQILNFNSTVALPNFDTDNYGSTVGTNGRLTVPAGQAGYYSIGGSVPWLWASGLTWIEMQILINGSVWASDVRAPMALAGGPPYNVQSLHTVIHLAASDYVQIAVLATIITTIEYVNGQPSFYLMRIS